MLRHLLPGTIGAMLVIASGCASDPGEADTTDPACKIASDKLISNFEDGMANVKQTGGRNGGWYSFNDKTMGATQSPAEGKPVSASKDGACGSKYALKTTGSGFTLWGAGIGTDLAAMGTTKTPYNVGQYQGITFQVKSGSGTLPIRFKVPDQQSTPATYGGTCSAGTMCDNNFGKDITVTTDWQKVELKWSDLAQEAGWGEMYSALQADKVLAIQFQVKAAAATSPFELWIDNVGFF